MPGGKHAALSSAASEARLEDAEEALAMAKAEVLRRCVFCCVLL